ncbi:hypothetical protein C0V75_18305 [Tabrizicola sp. TH137]|uniref:hypothetical protein n=1 Tax=Tabrizicola sp. TH137 TaxID=2067452 RepID=UPI000C7DF964|nr:hypothetical protein [Tabrizicola sp. TH137]PLL11227.1 hypothetical protein C0V75_18305 [Tabrizicola sp. TH137]
MTLFRKALFLAALLLAPLPATAQDLSARIAAQGLAATEAELAALPTPSEGDRFALAGLRFLRAIETTYQTRWRTGLDDPSGMVPLLRLEQGVSPEASSSPGDVAALFAQAATDMASARAPLAGLAEGPEFSVEIRLADLWFDVNADGTRTPDEDLMQLLGPTLMGWRWFDRDPAAPAPVIRFDRADAAWLSAYTHLLEGVAKIILAYDPTDALTRAASARAAMQAISPPYAEEIFVIRPWVDALWVMLDALDQQPDAARLMQARDHFLAMIADNRAFWAAVEGEADNDAEWLPNARQTSALGLTLPPETGATWLAVLADGEALLKGEKLIPYWRLGDGGGVNLARLFTDPAPIDVKDWIQGTGALPYLEQGATVSAENWRAFEGLMGGDAMLMSIWLN